MPTEGEYSDIISEKVGSANVRDSIHIANHRLSGINPQDNILIEPSSLLGGQTGSTINLKKIIYNSQTTNGYVLLYWEGESVDKLIMKLDGNQEWQVNIPNNASTPTGKLKVNFSGFAAGESYSLYLEFGKSENFSY